MAGKEGQPAVRPAILYLGVAILVAALGFFLVGKFVNSSPSEPVPATSPAPQVSTQSPTPAPTIASAEQVGIGRGVDPFASVAGAEPAAAAPPAAP